MLLQTKELPTIVLHNTSNKVKSQQIGDRLESRLCRRFVKGKQSPARGRHCPQSLTCSTRPTLSKVCDFCRPNMERPFDVVASVCGLWSQSDTVDFVNFPE